MAAKQDSLELWPGARTCVHSPTWIAMQSRGMRTRIACDFVRHECLSTTEPRSQASTLPSRSTTHNPAPSGSGFGIISPSDSTSDVMRCHWMMLDALLLSATRPYHLPQTCCHTDTISVEAPCQSPLCHHLSRLQSRHLAHAASIWPGREDVRGQARHEARVIVPYQWLLSSSKSEPLGSVQARLRRRPANPSILEDPARPN